MSTITYDALRFRHTDVYNPNTQEFEFDGTVVSDVDVDIVITADVTQFSYEQNGVFDEAILSDPDGEPLDAYAFRIDGQAVSFDEPNVQFLRIQWGEAQVTDLMVFDLGAVDVPPNSTDPRSFDFYFVTLGGDSITQAALADHEAWLASFPTTPNGDLLTFNVTNGPFVSGTLIDLSSPAGALAFSEDDVVDANFSPFTEFDLGAGDDTFVGSDADERVFSRKGSDVIDLGGGNDYVRVGGGVEAFYGGEGKDYISYYSSTNGITANLAEDTVSGSWAVNDIMVGFESISGSKNGNDSIIGTSGSNTIRTYGGNDRVAAGGGSDKVELGSGNDYVRVGGGVESFDGGSGNDYISYYSASNGIRIDLRDDEVSRSWAVNDTIKDFESASGSKTGHDLMLGTAGANTFRSYGGDDTLYGRGGSDKLYGGDGEDFLDGGGGDGIDLLYGGAGADIFEFDRGEGIDVIKDFEDDIDQINLDNFSFSTSEAYDFAEQVGADVIFDFGSDGMLTVENATIAELQNDLDVV